MTARYRLYGLTLQSDFRFDNRLAPGRGAPDLQFLCRPGPLWPGADAVPLYPPTEHLAGADIVLSRVHADWRLRFEEISEFHLSNHRIDARLTQPRYRYLVEIQFLGMVMSLFLERRGIPTLHASAVARDGAAIAFVGMKGAGKTSMAAAFLQDGWGLVTEDLLALDGAGAQVEAQSGYPQMRMWPAEARHFVGEVEALDIVHPAFDKRRVPVGAGGLGTFCAVASPLTAIYILERRGMDGSTEVRITPVSAQQAVIELIRYSFLPEMVHASGLGAQRLTAFADLAGRLTVRRVSYPSGLDLLPAARKAISDDARFV